MAVYLDVERPRVEGEGRADWTWARDSGTARRAEAIRVSTRRDEAEDSQLTEKGFSWPYNSTNSIQKTILSPTEPNVHSPLKTVLNTPRIYTERQQDIHQPQISVL